MQLIESRLFTFAGACIQLRVRGPEFRDSNASVNYGANMPLAQLERRDSLVLSTSSADRAS